ncbi:lipopolysaccharide biosynthesis protein [Salinicola endophyticus]|uniref:Lipopolysaccharide biosynthesis protein n=1 Tax=Salinicola endophyticus TaxID=1949083 RepID=A0AB74UAG9_9GAMM
MNVYNWLLDYKICIVRISQVCVNSGAEIRVLGGVFRYSMAVACLMSLTIAFGVYTMKVPAPSHSSLERGDDISPVDLMVILVRRRRVVMAVFVGMLIVLLLFLFFKKPVYQYTSSYEMAGYVNQSGELLSLESPNSVLAKAKNIYLMEGVRRFLENQGLKKLPFTLTVYNPKDTLLLNVESKATADQKGLVSGLHDLILNRLGEDQKRLVGKYRKTLSQQLEDVEKALAAAQKSESQNANELVADYFTRASELRSKIEGLEEGGVNQIAFRSLEKVDTSRFLMIALGVPFVAILAMLIGFLTEFSAVVKRRLDNQ